MFYVFVSLHEDARELQGRQNLAGVSFEIDVEKRVMHVPNLGQILAAFFTASKSKKSCGVTQ